MQSIRTLNQLAITAILACGSVQANPPPVAGADIPVTSYPAPAGGWEIHASKAGTLVCNAQSILENVIAASDFDIGADGPAGVGYWSTPEGRADIKKISPNNALDVRGSLLVDVKDHQFFVRIGAYNDTLGGNRLWASVDEAQWQSYATGSDYTWHLCSVLSTDH